MIMKDGLYMKPEKNSMEFKKAVTVEEMRAADEYTIKNFVPGKVLMKRAAEGIFEACDWQGKCVAIVAGGGNNGGDGYALAEILTENGVKVEIFKTSDSLSDDGKYYYDRCEALGVCSKPFCEDTVLGNFDIIVDCIFGTGFKGTPRGIAAKAIETINCSGAFVVSADINSGLNGNTGEAVLAVKSDLTVSIGFFKKGMFLGKGPSLIKELVNVDIGIVAI